MRHAHLFPSYPEVVEILGQSAPGVYSFIPVSCEVMADTETPVSLLMKLRRTGSCCFLLDSAESPTQWGRYSFVGRDPLLIMRQQKDGVLLTYRDGHKEMRQGDPFACIRQVMAGYRSIRIPGLPEFCGGAVGYLGYDMVRYIEKLPDLVKTEQDATPRFSLMVTDESIAFDHLKQSIIITVNMPCSGDIDRHYQKTAARITSLLRMVRRPGAIGRGLSGNGRSDSLSAGSVPAGNMSSTVFEDMVRKARQYIFDGDIFQVVLSQRFAVETPVDPLDVYRVLRLANPSPYMYFLQFEDSHVVGASPEMLLRLRNGLIETCPIAGTRPRGRDEAEDLAFENDLSTDPKEIAEHTMLLDLGRNDIGRVAQPGSVRIAAQLKVVRFSRVMHLVSVVEGRLRDDLDVYDAFRSVFPAGTLSGAPKVRAMEIIEELEPTRRGIYGGAICYISFSGDFDSCITIRTAHFRDGVAYIQTGAGIVADSDPAQEYQETIHKAGALFRALKEAMRG